jgi:hypothetical protein
MRPAADVELGAVLLAGYTGADGVRVYVTTSPIEDTDTYAHVPLHSDLDGNNINGVPVPANPSSGELVFAGASSTSTLVSASVSAVVFDESTDVYSADDVHEVASLTDAPTSSHLRWGLHVVLREWGAVRIR